MGTLAGYLRQALQAGRRICTATVVESRLQAVPAGTTWAVDEGEACCFLPDGELARPDVPPARPDVHAASPAAEATAYADSPHGGAQDIFQAVEQAVLARCRHMLQQARKRPPGRSAPVKDRLNHLLWPDPTAPWQVRAFVELLEPPPRLVLIGAGEDAPPLCRIAAEAGFDVRVTDPRPAYARADRFPEASEVVCGEPDDLPPGWFTGDCYAVVMNHHFLRDVAAVGALIARSVPYVGILGPRARAERLVARLEREMGRPLAAEELDRLYSPVGLDIGGETPGAIALGIVAEIMAFRYGRPAPHMRDRRGPLHPDRLDALAAHRQAPPAAQASAVGSPSGPVWAVVLAAGESRRMGGRPKQVLEVAGEPLVRRAARIALEAGAAGVVVVTGAAAEEVGRALAGLGPQVRLVFNPEFASGMASSLRTGIGALPKEASGALVLLADQFRVSARLLSRLMQAASTGAGAACRYPDGTLGAPCVLNRPLWRDVAGLRGDRGARSLLEAYSSHVEAVGADPAELADLDTPEDLARILDTA